MTTYIVNAFSLNMLSDFPALPFVQQVTLETVRTAVVGRAVDGGSYHAVSLVPGIVPAVGHADTAAIMDKLLGLHYIPVGIYPELAPNPSSVLGRVTVALEQGDVLYVAQYKGPRLPEGATSLPEGAELMWLRVDMLDAVALAKG